MTMMQSNEPLWDLPSNIPIFNMAMVASAVGVTAGTLRVWIQRGHIKLFSEDTKAHTNGAPNRFTLRSVLTLGVTAELVRVGVPTASAFSIAEHWALFGNVAGEMSAPAHREPAGLFPAPYNTYLIVAPNRQSNGPRIGREALILAVDPADPRAQTTFSSALFDAARPGARVVWLNLIDRRVRAACEAALQGTSSLSDPTNASDPVSDGVGAQSEIIESGEE